MEAVGFRWLVVQEAVATDLSESVSIKIRDDCHTALLAEFDAEQVLGIQEGRAGRRMLQNPNSNVSTSFVFSLLPMLSSSRDVKLRTIRTTLHCAWRLLRILPTLPHLIVVVVVVLERVLVIPASS
jgi:hypothetical protein